MRVALRSAYLWVGLCISTFFLTVILSLSPTSIQAQPPTPTVPPPQEITQGWQYRWGESPVDNNGIPVWTMDESPSPEWRSFQVPGRIPKQSGRDFLWLRVPIPTDLFPYPSLYLGGIPNLLEAYLNDQLIYIYYELDSWGDIKLEDNKWPIVPLEPDYQNKTLFFRVYTGNLSSLPIGLLDRVSIGSQPDLIKNLIQKDIVRVILGFVFLFIGLFSGLFFFRRQQRSIYFAFGLLSLLIGIYTIARTEVILLLFNRPWLWNYIHYTSFYLIPVGVCAFFEQIFIGSQAIARRLWRFHLIYAFISLIFVTSRIIPWTYTIFPTNILIVFSSLILIFKAIKISSKGNIEAKLFTAGFIVFLLSAIHDIFVYMFDFFPWKVEIYYWGMFVFIVFLGIILDRRFAEARNQLQAYAVEMEAKNTALQRMDKLKDEFLANTSHELRTPLNGIIGITESLIDGATGGLSQQTRFNLSLVVSSGKRLAQLVNDILDFSQLKHKRIELKLQPVGIKEITDVVLMLSQPLIGNKPVEIINNISTEIPSVWADENRVQQILHNLVGNAIKFTDKGKIEVSAVVVNQEVRITVSDTGIGISNNKLSRIFESFEQADGSISREYGGTGLGLAVTQQLVYLHKGKIFVESTLGEGSQFTFTLPISQEEVVKKPPIPELIEPIISSEEIISSSITQPSTQEHSFHILIVDDEPINLQVLVNHLSLQNYALTQASNGLEALDIIAQGFKPDLVLLDVMMPKMTGYELCQRIREHFPANEVPVVLLTAKDQVSDLVVGFGSGANDYLTKPVSKEELLARIKTHIQLSKINLAYGRFVPHEFLRFLGHESIVNVQLGDQVQKEMTVLFSDIRSFTTLSESMSPKETFDFINDYLKRVGPVIRNHNGFIDKYIGDAVMALFPNIADEALQAAVEIQKQVTIYNSERLKGGYPTISIGVGLHTGTLMLGTIGEEQRMESTVIADAVNLASRLEGLTKIYGAGILISEQTLLQLNDAQMYSSRFLDRVRVKGKRAAVAVFEVYDGDSEPLKELKSQTRSEFEQAVVLYHQRKFAQAQKLFLRVFQKNNQDRSTILYLQRCNKIRKYGRVEEGGERLEDSF